MRLGAFGRLFAPGYSLCTWCGTPWRFVEPHIVSYSASRGVFTLCERCWDECPLDRRIELHRRQFGYREDWLDILFALTVRPAVVRFGDYEYFPNALPQRIAPSPTSETSCATSHTQD